MKGNLKGEGPLVSRSEGNKGQGTLEERGVRRRVRGAEYRNRQGLGVDSTARNLTELSWGCQ